MRATGVPDGWLYAIGDVNGRNQLTHMGKYQARVCGDVIVARAKGLPDNAPALHDIADDIGAPQEFSPTPRSSPSGAPRRRLTQTASPFAPSSTISLV
jgi:dihydrolipoamide dehydrogenase